MDDKERTDDLNEEKVLFEWVAAERAFQKRNRDFWITAIAILVLGAVVLIFINEVFLIVALVSLLFLFYVLSTVPPADVKYKITNRGVYFGDNYYFWDTLENFWFKPSLSTDMVHFGTFLRFPSSISLVINPDDQEKIKEIVVKRIPLVEQSPKFIDKLTTWFAERMPLEDRPETNPKTEKKD